MSTYITDFGNQLEKISSPELNWLAKLPTTLPAGYVSMEIVQLEVDYLII